MDETNLPRNYFTVTPMSQKVENLEPGQTYTGSITVINPATAEEDFYYSVSVAPYGVMGTNYAANLTSETGYTQLAKWITIDEPTGTISPNGVATVNYTITVPENAPGGGQYAALIVSKDPKVVEGMDKGVSVQDVYEMASLIYADIAGETIHKGEILENNISAFVVNPKIDLGVLISNGGNVHEIATIIIEATDFFTGDVILEAEDKTDYYTELIMPESTRYVERSINNNLPQLGVVKVSQTVYYNGGYSKQERDVIICPIWFLLLIFFILFMLVGMIVGLAMRHRKKGKKKKVVVEKVKE